jgi:hypothetical protein
MRTDVATQPTIKKCVWCDSETVTVKHWEINFLQYKFQIDNPGNELESPSLQDYETVAELNRLFSRHKGT